MHSWWPGSTLTSWGSYSAPPDPLAVKEEGEGNGRMGRGRRDKKGREGWKGERPPAPSAPRSSFIWS